MKKEEKREKERQTEIDRLLIAEDLHLGLGDLKTARSAEEKKKRKDMKIFLPL